MKLYYPVDRAIQGYQPNIPVKEIQELNSQMNCNLYNSEENEDWFDWDDDLEMMSEIDEEWFFEYV